MALDENHNLCRSLESKTEILRNIKTVSKTSDEAVYTPYKEAFKEAFKETVVSSSEETNEKAIVSSLEKANETTQR